MNEDIKKHLWMAMTEYQNKNIEKSGHIIKIKRYLNMEFENLSMADIPYIEEFISCVRNKDAKKFLKNKVKSID